MAPSGIQATISGGADSVNVASVGGAIGGETAIRIASTANAAPAANRTGKALAGQKCAEGGRTERDG